jgi:hypothetical protein
MRCFEATASLLLLAAAATIVVGRQQYVTKPPLKRVVRYTILQPTADPSFLF